MLACCFSFNDLNFYSRGWWSCVLPPSCVQNPHSGTKVSQSSSLKQRQAPGSRTATAEVFYTEMVSEPQELSATLKSVLGVKNFTFKKWLQCLCQVQQLEGASDPSAPLPAAAH